MPSESLSTNWGNRREQAIRRSRRFGVGRGFGHSARQAGRFRLYRHRILANIHTNSRRFAARIVFRENGSFRRARARRHFDGRIRHFADRKLVRMGLDEIFVAFFPVRGGGRAVRILRIRLLQVEDGMDGRRRFGRIFARIVRHDAAVDVGRLFAGDRPDRFRSMALVPSAADLVGWNAPTERAIRSYTITGRKAYAACISIRGAGGFLYTDL